MAGLTKRRTASLKGGTSSPLGAPFYAKENSRFPYTFPGFGPPINTAIKTKTPINRICLWAFVLNGGVDGARARDLLRDRQAL